jgi:hypothetical protein
MNDRLAERRIEMKKKEPVAWWLVPLILCVLALLAGIGLSVARGSWGPLIIAGFFILFAVPRL